MPNWLIFLLISLMVVKNLGVVGYIIYRLGYEAGCRDCRHDEQQRDHVMQDPSPPTS